MKYEDYKELTIEDYRELWKEKNGHVGMVLYQYCVVIIKHTAGEMEWTFVDRFIHHDIEIARKAAFEFLEEKKKDLEGEYSIDVIEDYDPELGISLNFGILLTSTSDASHKITIETTMADFYNQPEEEERVFDELRKLNPDSSFLDNIIKPKGLIEMIGNIKIPNKKGAHTVKLPGGIHMMFNVT